MRENVIGEVINRVVKQHGHGGYIYCPKRWLGCTVRVEVQQNKR